MSNLEPMISYVFAWHSHGDACKKCQMLNGREWREQDIFQERLYDMFYGDVWDLDADHSLAHGAQQFHCRCQLEVRVEAIHFEELSQIQDLNRALEMLL